MQPSAPTRSVLIGKLMDHVEESLSKLVNAVSERYPPFPGKPPEYVQGLPAFAGIKGLALCP